MLWIETTSISYRYFDFVAWLVTVALTVVRSSWFDGSLVGNHCYTLLLSHKNKIIHGCIEIETQFAYIPDAMSTRLLSLFMLQWARYVHESMTWTFVFVITFAQLAQLVNYSIHVNYSDRDNLGVLIYYPKAKEI